MARPRPCLTALSNGGSMGGALSRLLASFQTTSSPGANVHELGHVRPSHGQPDALVAGGARQQHGLLARSWGGKTSRFLLALLVLARCPCEAHVFRPVSLLCPGEPHQSTSPWPRGKCRKLWKGAALRCRGSLLLAAPPPARPGFLSQTSAQRTMHHKHSWFALRGHNQGGGRFTRDVGPLGPWPEPGGLGRILGSKQGWQATNATTAPADGPSRSHRRLPYTNRFGSARSLLGNFEP